MLDPDQPVDDFRSALASVDRRGRRQWLYVDIASGRGDVYAAQF